MPLNDRDSLIEYRLPPVERCATELQPLVKEYGKLLNDRRAAQKALGQLEDEHTRAVEADTDALARALRDGKPDPGNKHVEKLIKERENTRRTIVALEKAILNVEAEIADAFEATKDDQREELDAEIVELADEYQAAIGAVGLARHKLASAVGMRSFLASSFPEEDDRGRTPGYHAGGWPIWKLTGPSGDPLDFGSVLDALNYDAQLAKEQPKATHQPVAAGSIVEAHMHEVDVDSRTGSALHHETPVHLRRGINERPM